MSFAVLSQFEATRSPVVAASFLIFGLLVGSTVLTYVLARAVPVVLAGLVVLELPGKSPGTSTDSRCSYLLQASTRPLRPDGRVARRMAPSLGLPRRAEHW